MLTLEQRRRRATTSPGCSRQRGWSPAPTLVVIALLLTAGCGHKHHTSQAAPPSDSTTAGPGSGSAATAHTSIPALTPSRAAALAKDLTSGTTTGIGQALDVPAGQQLDPGAAAQFASVGPITINAATFRPVDSTHGTADGTVAHPVAGGPGTWRFAFVVVSGQWKIADAEPAS